MPFWLRASALRSAITCASWRSTAACQSETKPRVASAWARWACAEEVWAPSVVRAPACASVPACVRAPACAGVPGAADAPCPEAAARLPERRPSPSARPRSRLWTVRRNASSSKTKTRRSLARSPCSSKRSASPASVRGATNSSSSSPPSLWATNCPSGKRPINARGRRTDPLLTHTVVRSSTWVSTFESTARDSAAGGLCMSCSAAMCTLCHISRAVWSSSPVGNEQIS